MEKYHFWQKKVLLLISKKCLILQDEIIQLYKTITSGVEEVEVAEPVGVKEEVLLDEKWSGADEEKCGQQADRCRGDRSLHYHAVGAPRRNIGDRSEERQDKGE